MKDYYFYTVMAVITTALVFFVIGKTSITTHQIITLNGLEYFVCSEWETNLRTKHGFKYMRCKDASLIEMVDLVVLDPKDDKK